MNPDKFSDEKRVETLKVLEMNNFNVSKTSRITGVSRPSIIRWREELGHLVFKKDRIDNPADKPDIHRTEVEQAVVDTEAEIEELDESFIRKADSVRNELIQKVRELIPRERNMYNIARSIEILSKIITDKNNEEDDGGEDFMELLEKKITNGKNDSSEGHS